MFITWMKAVGGRMKSDPSFSSTITWNNFPLPALDAAQRDAIALAGQRVLNARELHPERSLAQHYSPLAMDPALVKAHDTLDRVVDGAFGAKRALRSNEDRAALLFDQYAAMTSS